MSRIDGEPLDLVEHVGVRGVGIVAAIDLARHDDAHRRSLLLHGVHLHGRGVRAEQMRRRSRRKIEVKRVHGVARGMVLGDVERLEIVVRRLDLSPSTTVKPSERKMRSISSKVCRTRWREPAAEPRRAARDRSVRGRGPRLRPLGDGLLPLLDSALDVRRSAR